MEAVRLCYEAMTAQSEHNAGDFTSLNKVTDTASLHLTYRD